eukprot:CAMPEP_0119104618 /NCGR_PEP_ID=MMETSP1180-20130426/2788_1 /TAXON_ID=3052 ORGANISM="Chlamydomonas cf sp, Strain CCMP681" /NCGR_SAMPLE_ID=MMETSP1180 /ASSEMBLY_ACC=CAM_ASM_000741 /LENGTH=430 /DNA_ID=CAMNT_0007089433 /DNA_START=132 /DNA_END=1424 /DNA_ORIENTATION=+
MKLPPLVSQQAGGTPQGKLRSTFTPTGAAANRDLTSQEKKTFKEKLQDAILQAEEAELTALRDAQLQDKKSLSVSLLVDGRPQAFVDYFGLTHPSKSSMQGEPEGELPQESLLLLRTQLAQADAARRMDNVQEVYAAFKHLAKYFVQLGRLRTAEFFFKRCLQTSADAEWLPGELEANLALGVVYEQLQDTGAAINCHERRLELASHHQLQAEMDTAFHSLTTVYLTLAGERERTGDLDGALDAFNRCLRAADKAGNVPAAARANHKMGMLYFQMSRWQDAIFFLRRFLEVASGSLLPDQDPAAEGQAATAYAQCLERTGNVAGAIQSLENYFHTLARGADQWGPAYACCSLGTLYYSQKDMPQAVTYFERFFELARSLPDRRVVEVARVNLGMARGALRMQAYFELVDTDLPRLIAWKSALSGAMAGLP